MKSMKALALMFAVLPMVACGDDSTPSESEGTTSDEETESADPTTNPSTTVNPSTTIDPSTTTEDPTTTEPTTTGETETTTEPTTTGETETTTEPTTTGETETDPSTSTGMTSECVEVQVSDVAFAGTDGVVSFYESTTFTPGIGGTDEDIFRIEFYNSDTGTFDLASAGANDNYQTCVQCVRIFEDFDGADIARQYFQSAGSLDVDGASDQVGGILIASLTDVTLVEVTIDEDFLSTPVADGACVDLVSPTDILVVPWNCDPESYADGVVCDCGCGSVDPDCADASEGSCDECNGTGSCAQEETGCDNIVDDDNSTCDVPGAWACSAGFWNTDDGCDCGCGAWDPDCGATDNGVCGFCSDTGSCQVAGLGCPGVIDADENWLCDPLAIWTCAPAAYDDGATCDCGCAAPDPDCADDFTDGACEECNGTGSCAEGEGDCSLITDDLNPHCEAPPEWTCSAGFYGDGDCDCGCGALDVYDCADASVDSCEFCNDTGSCDDTGAGCPGVIDMNENWLCE